MIVCESLFSFLKLNENMELAKQAFQNAGYGENSQEWKDFIDIFGKDVNYLEKFSEWILTGNKNAFRYLAQAYSRLKRLNIDLNPNSFTSLDDYIFNANEEIDKAIEKQKEEIVKTHAEEIKEIDKTLEDTDYLIKKLNLVLVKRGERGLYCTQDVKNSPDLNERGQGVYIWTDLPLLARWDGKSKELKTNFKFGQYGANVKIGQGSQKTENTAVDFINNDPGIIGKTPGETIKGYAGTYLSHKVLLYAKNLNEYLKSPSSKFKDAFEVEQAVKNNLKSGKWDSRTHTKSTEVYYGGTLQELIQTINKVLTGSTRSKLQPREEQKVGTNKIIEFFKNPDKKEFLLAAKMRYGKNITVLNAIKNLSEQADIYKNCLILTYKPQVFSSLKDDVKNFSDFENFEVVDIKKENKISETSDKVRIFISSAQYAMYGGLDEDGDDEVLNESKEEKQENLLKLSTEEEVEELQKNAYKDYEKNLDKIKNIHFGIIIADEYHYGAKSKNFQTLLKNLSYEKIIYVSGTAMKDLATGKFDEDQVYNWTYIDEQEQKQKELKLKEKNEDGYYPHIDMPTMHFYKMDLSPDAKRLAQDRELFTKEQGVSFKKLIDVDKNGKLVNEELAKILIEQILNPTKYGPLYSIRNQGVTGTNLDHTFWVMAKSVEGIKAFANLMNEMKKTYRWMQDYEIIPATGELNNNIDKVKNKIKEAKNKGEKSITLSCYRFKEGTTVPEWGAVVMLDDGISAEEYLQAIFRCQSPARKGEPIKENCYVFDFNPQRLLLIYHDIAQWAGKTGKESQFELIRKFLQYAPIVQSDGNQMVEVDEKQIINNFRLYGSFSEKMASDRAFNYDFLQNALSEDIVEGLLGISSKKNATNIQISDSGVERGKSLSSRVAKDTNDDFDEDDWKKELNETDLEKIKEKIRNVLRMIPAFLFASKYDEQTVEHIFKTKEGDLFEEICGVSPKLFGKLIDKKILNARVLNETIGYFSDTINKLEDSIGKNPSVEEADSFISKHLNIKGESGSTPAKLVNEMLDKLPYEVWTDPNKKFCDPCMGTGKYLLGIKKRLMDNLPNNINGKYNSNEKEKYIVENMLWGIDVAKGKTSMAKKLINNKGYKDHLIQGDSLELNWNKMPKFDVVVGNPPFQPPVKSEGAGSGSRNKIWHKFVELGFEILKEDGWFAFITPFNWRMSNIKKGVERNAQELMWNNNIIDITPANKFFDVGGNVAIDYWIITKNKAIKGLNIPNEFRKLMFYPLNEHQKILQFLKALPDIPYKSIKDSHFDQNDNYYEINIDANDKRNFNFILNTNGDDDHKYPHLNTMEQYKKNVFEWFNKKTIGFDNKKVIISNSVGIGTPNVIFSVYDDGKIGCGSHAVAYQVSSEEEGKKLEKFLNKSNIIKILFKESSHPTGFGINLHIVKRIPKSLVERFNNGEDL
jgi:hypothetical protein